MRRSARWRCGLGQAREKDTLNEGLPQTAAAILVPRTSVSLSAVAAAELGRSAILVDYDKIGDQDYRRDAGDRGAAPWSGGTRALFRPTSVARRLSAREVLAIVDNEWASNR